MDRIFRFLDLDQASFLIGFVTGILFLWLFQRSWPMLKQFGRVIRYRIEKLREGVTTGAEARFRADLLRMVQAKHLTSQICALDEILIPPKVFFPIRSLEEAEDLPDYDTTEQLLPFLPDFPEIATAFGQPGVPLWEGLQAGASIMLLGHPGIGKTIALCHFASQLARRDENLGSLQDHLPLFVESRDLLAFDPEISDVYETIYTCVSKYASTITQARLANVVKSTLDTNRAILLIDGADELPPDSIEQVGQWVAKIKTSYPHLQMVVVASPWMHDSFLVSGLQPAGLLLWNDREKKLFVEKWKHVWNEIIFAQAINPYSPVNPVLLSSWLKHSPYQETPFDFTLRVWAIFAGDTLGETFDHSLEAYIRRILREIPNGRKVLAQIALSLLTEQRAGLSRNEILQMASESMPMLFSPNLPETSSEDNHEGSSQSTAGDIEKISPSTRLINDLLQSGMLRQTSSGSISFTWIKTAAYLAAEAINDPSRSAAILEQPRWELRQCFYKYLASQIDISPQFLPILENLDEPLLNHLIELGSWSHQAPDRFTWTKQVLRTLTSEVSNVQRPFGLRLRLAALLAGTGSKSTDVLFRRMVQQSEPQARFAGCLGTGLMKDVKALADLKAAIQDPDPGVRKSAVLALGAIGGKQAMEYIAFALLQNDESLQKCAAEVLASDEHEGYETLREGSEFDDLLVRRAVVSGLKKIDTEWSTELLEKIRMEESQWVVRNAAERAINQLNRLHPMVPKPFPKLQDTPWLVKYASSQGRGISSAAAAEEVLLSAAQNGNYEEKKLAFYRIVYLPKITEGVSATLYRSLYSEKGELQQEAMQSLWLISGRSINLPEPMQFGYA